MYFVLWGPGSRKGAPACKVPAGTGRNAAAAVSRMPAVRLPALAAPRSLHRLGWRPGGSASVGPRARGGGPPHFRVDADPLLLLRGLVFGLVGVLVQAHRLGDKRFHVRRHLRQVLGRCALLPSDRGRSARSEVRTGESGLGRPHPTQSSLLPGRLKTVGRLEYRWRYKRRRKTRASPVRRNRTPPHLSISSRRRLPLRGADDGRTGTSRRPPATRALSLTD